MAEQQKTGKPGEKKPNEGRPRHAQPMEREDGSPGGERIQKPDLERDDDMEKRRAGEGDDIEREPMDEDVEE